VLCLGSLGDPDLAHRVRFFFDLCLRGHVRFPTAVMKERLAAFPYPPAASTPAEASDLVTDFFRAFSIDPGWRDRIDIVRQTPCAFLLTSANGQTYADGTMVPSFLGDVVRTAKEWFATQHGDRFALFMKRRIEAAAPGAAVVKFRELVAAPDGERAECDLLVERGGELLVVECKASAKPDEFLLGGRDAVRLRDLAVSSWVRQARRAADVVASRYPGRRVQWVVCTPAQEYLHPLDRHGMLAPDIPRVCTAEELLDHLTSGCARSKSAPD
jgi:hypothetical protein